MLNINLNAEEVFTKIKEYFKQRDDVAAVYVFGSIIEDEEISNDIDILILSMPDVDEDDTIVKSIIDLSKMLKIPEKKLDIIPFSFDKVELLVLYNAVKKGRLLVENDSRVLSSRIEELSFRMMKTEPLRIRDKEYLKDILFRC